MPEQLPTEQPAHAAGIRRILILDDDGDFRALLRAYLGKMFQQAELEEYDPVARGVPGETFDWSRYDVLILDYYLCIHNLTGLDILQANRKNRFFPAAIMLTGAGNEEVAVRAVRAGVYDYLRKEKLDKEQLRNSILSAFEQHLQQQQRLKDQTNQSLAFNKAVFYQQLEHPPEGNGEARGRVLLVIQLDEQQRLEERLGVILRDNIVRHLAKCSFEVFQLGACHPHVTRLGEGSVALIIDRPESLKTLQFNLNGLCTYLGKQPYRFEDRKFRFSVSVGAVDVPAAGGSADLLIRQALEAAAVAAATPGNSFHIHAPAAPAAAAPAPLAPVSPDIAPEPKPGAMPAPPEVPAAEVPAPPAPADAETAPAPSLAPPPGPAVAPVPEPRPAPSATTAPAPPAPAPTAPAAVKRPDRDELVLDTTRLTEAELRIKTAFDEKRVVPWFRPVIALFNSEEQSEPEVYRVLLQIVQRDGSFSTEQEIYGAIASAELQKFMDRWLLRETIGRVVNNPDRGVVFVLRITGASLADPGLFNWLRKVLAGLDRRRPGARIILEMTLDDFSAERRKADALLSYLARSHGFRFALKAAGDAAAIGGVIDGAGFHLLRVGYATLSGLQAPPANGQAAPVLRRVLDRGVRVVVDDVEDATTLTGVIGAGAHYAMGDFIGEPMQHLEDTTNVESFEIS